MAIDAVKIPQNVYVEDRIIGPVTLRQLIITGLGAGFSYAMFAGASKSGVTNVVFLASCWIPAVIAAMFSFLKLNDLTLFNIILLGIEGFNKPRARTWVSGSGISIDIITKPTKKEVEAQASKIGVAPIDKIADVTRELHEREKKLKELTTQSPRFNEPEESEEIVVRDAKKEEGSALPVNKNRVRTQSFPPNVPSMAF